MSAGEAEGFDDEADGGVTHLDDDDDVITCWCGATGTADELFDDAVYGQSCGGTGTLHCECGGDFCVCHHHGEVPCEGCEDCRADDDGFDDNYDDPEGD